MTTVTVGIRHHAYAGQLDATLAALAAEAVHRPQTLLLLDGAEPGALVDGLRRHGPLPPTAAAPSAPACFNRLASGTDSEVIILLESGAIPAAGALDRLVEALKIDRRNGLAGPSTNIAWNEQGCFFGAGEGDVETTGADAARRFGDDVRTLAPLHSLSDFCYAVRRDVIDAIGGADERYGRGPCWEMEYNARAARAGFRAVWVCGAYVYRPPFTAARRMEEDQLFDASRQLYQDSLCGLRLRGLRGPYQPHCRGEACEHFAPAGRIQIRRPPPAFRATSGAAGNESFGVVRNAAGKAGEARARDGGMTIARVAPVPPQQPLLSCVMPTGNRAEFALHAVSLFQRQDYEHRELVILDDGSDGLERLLPDDDRIRYERTHPGQSIGAKRNRACSLARGEFMIQWDDDDWYGPPRCRAQLQALLAGRADITALRTPLYFELESRRFWTVSAHLHRRLFVEDVHGGTLAFARRVWDKLSRYPDASLAEDAAFLRQALRRGARLERLAGDGLFVYVRHGANAWQFPCGSYLDPSGWQLAPPAEFSPEDRRFYDLPPAGGAEDDAPLVSCVMPTADRRRHVARAIAYFLRQDYANRELVVLDDGHDRVQDLMPDDPRVRYIALDGRLMLGEKRNRACELARGEIIVHWDDDDWQAPHRLSYQASELQRHDAPVCGLHRMLYFDPATTRAWWYEYPLRVRRWLAGPSLCYRKETWHRNPFERVAVGEDSRFVWSRHTGTPLVLDDHRFTAALMHTGNTSRKQPRPPYWSECGFTEVRELLGPDYDAFGSRHGAV